MHLAGVRSRLLVVRVDIAEIRVDVAEDGDRAGGGRRVGGVVRYRVIIQRTAAVATMAAAAYTHLGTAPPSAGELPRLAASRLLIVFLTSSGILPGFGNTGSTRAGVGGTDGGEEARTASALGGT